MSQVIPAICALIALYFIGEHMKLPTGCGMCGGKHRHRNNCPYKET